MNLRSSKTKKKKGRDKNRKMQEPTLSKNSVAHCWKEQYATHLAEQLKEWTRIHSDQAVPQLSFFEYLYAKDFGCLNGKFTEAETVHAIEKVPQRSSDTMRTLLATEAAMLDEKQMEELKVLRASDFPVEELYGYLFRVKLNTIETIRHRMRISNRTVIREDAETTVLSAAGHHIRRREEEFINDFFVELVEGWYNDGGSEDESDNNSKDASELCMNTQVGCLRGLFPGCLIDGESLVPLARFNTWCKEQKDHAGLMPRLCLQEGLCYFDKESKQCRLFLSMQAFRRLHDQCAAPIQQEYQVRKWGLNHLLNSKIILKYDIIGVSLTKLDTLRPMLQAVIELQGLEVSSISFERPNTVTIFGTPKPIWHFSRNQCHYRSTVHNDILGCLVKTFCTRLATNDQYCQEHYEKSRDDYRSRRKPRGQELRERLAYINQPMVRPISLQLIVVESL